MDDEATLRITRYRPEQSPLPFDEDFRVPFRRDMMVLDALNHVKDRVDGSLTFRWSCRMGICGSCGATVNGEPILTCETFLHEVVGRGGVVTVEPLHHFPVIKDLVVDIDGFMEHLQAVQPWLVRRDPRPVGEGEYLQFPVEMEDYHQQSLCINCMVCYAACPVFGLEPDFIGPAALALAYRYNMDSRDQGGTERLRRLEAADGVWECSFVGECSVACPKDVDPAGAIQRLKAPAAMDTLTRMLRPPFLR